MHHIYTTLTRNISCDKAVSAASQSLPQMGRTPSTTHLGQLLYRCSIYSLLTRNWGVLPRRVFSATSQSLPQMGRTTSTTHLGQLLYRCSIYSLLTRNFLVISRNLRSLNHWLEWNVRQVLSIRTNFFPRPHLTTSNKKLGLWYCQSITSQYQGYGYNTLIRNYAVVVVKMLCGGYFLILVFLPIFVARLNAILCATS